MESANKPDGRRLDARRWAFRIAVGMAILTVLALSIGWIALRFIPGWYRPAYVPYEDEQEVRDRLGAAFTALSHGMAQGRSFDFAVRQDDLNAWLVARDRIWPASKRWIPKQIMDPMIVFENGDIVLAGTWCGPGPRTIVSVRLRPERVEDRLRVRVEGVRCGALPVPLALIRRGLVRFEQSRADTDEPLLSDGASLADAADGAPIPRDIPWTQPRGKFLLEAVSAVPGELRVRLDPLKRQGDGRGKPGR
ncbi:MAG: hypothetical protein JXQ73_02110 [Phycisphaerae bacterium]|nr:hypothetical protein [Phycisphaerae bacterium]